MSRVLIAVGVVLILAGVFWGPLSRLPIGRLPGDISIVRPGFRLYVPVTSAVLVSVVVSGAIALVRYLMR